MDKISFQSRIRAISLPQYQDYVQKVGFQNRVSFPWTIKESVLERGAYTTGVLDCSALGVTDGQKVLLMHLCPTMFVNHDLTRITKYIEKNLAGMNNGELQGFLLGSNKTGVDFSGTLFDHLLAFMKNRNISTSYFKGTKCDTHVAYSSVDDEWVISNVKADFNKSTMDFIKENFDEHMISTLDVVV